MSVVSDRYVEVTYDINGQTTFRGGVFKASNPNEALKLAKADCLEAHPDAVNVEEFLQRRLTVEQALDIRRQISRGTWSGWQFVKEV